MEINMKDNNQLCMRLRRKVWTGIMGMLLAGMIAACGVEESSDLADDSADENIAETTKEERTSEETEEDESKADGKGLGDRARRSPEEQEKFPEEQEEISILPETVLWFNGTYAALTYSNGWDWHLVGGVELTEDNIDLTKALLYYDWSVIDRESALVTADILMTEGHRGKCQECMDELEEWGLLELNQEEFVDKLLEIEPEGNLGRYILTYDMYLNGIEPEYIAAFDLCRVNQLYAAYYVCGFMDYEEAMDASLENSLILQKMYGSWEEMMDAYMLGFQFWKGDLEITDDSPTIERYHYYMTLHSLEDNPYNMDWNMELKKSW